MRALREDFASLREAFHAVVELVVVDELPFTQVAEVLGITLAARIRLQRAQNFTAGKCHQSNERSDVSTLEGFEIQLLVELCDVVDERGTPVDEPAQLGSLSSVDIAGKRHRGCRLPSMALRDEGVTADVTYAPQGSALAVAASWVPTVEGERIDGDEQANGVRIWLVAGVTTEEIQPCVVVQSSP